MPDKSILQSIEVLFLRRIAALFRRGNIDRVAANLLVKDLMALTPFDSREDLHEKIKRYIAQHPEMDMIEMPILEDADRKKALDDAQHVLSSIST